MFIIIYKNLHSVSSLRKIRKSRSQKRASDPEFHTPYMHGSICNSTLTWDPVREQYYLNGRFKKAGQIDFINVSY